MALERKEKMLFIFSLFGWVGGGGGGGMGTHFSFYFAHGRTFTFVALRKPLFEGSIFSMYFYVLPAFG